MRVHHQSRRTPVPRYALAKPNNLSRQDSLPRAEPMKLWLDDTLRLKSRHAGFQRFSKKFRLEFYPKEQQSENSFRMGGLTA
jgi:hypothetical protein